MECENGVCKLPTAIPTLGAAAAANGSSNIDVPTPAIPDQFKSFPWSHLVNAAGKRVPTSALQRPLTMYLFSAAWCPPCQKLAPTIEALHKAHHETDIDIVYVGFDTTHEEHRTKAKLPYFKFTWFQDEELQVPIPCEKYEDQPGNANPFRTVFSNVLFTLLGKRGIPSIIVVDSTSGKIVDDQTTMVLFNVHGSKTLDTDLKAIVSHWRAGQPASTRWMRIRSAIIVSVIGFVIVYMAHPIARVVAWIKGKFTKTPPNPDLEAKHKEHVTATEKPATLECESGVCPLPAVKKEGESAQTA